MANFWHTLKQANSHYGSVVAFAIGLIIGGLMMQSVLPHAAKAPTETGQSGVKEVVAAPVRLRIPAADIDTKFVEPLGVNDDQTVEVPDSYEAVGWYKHGPRPGELGPAVILGHVDSVEGPAVFYNLQFTKPGDIIEIERADGSIGKFEITKLTHRSQSNFPTEEVYGNLDHAGLRLITCSGIYDHGTLRYSHNLIVFAKLIEEISPKMGEG